MMEKHTPGPWEVVYRDDDNHMCMTVIAPKGSMGPTANVGQFWADSNSRKAIAITLHQSAPNVGEDAFDQGQDDANAHLIAAAPDLISFAQSDDLEWLLFQAIHGDMCADDPETLRRLLRIQQARLAVIAKATLPSRVNPTPDRPEAKEE